MASMARISGVNIPREKRVEISLTYIYGIGLTTANKILKTLKIDKNIRVKDLAEEQVNALRQMIEKSYKVEGELKRDKLANIKRLKEIKAYRGTRHAKNLPARGQRTKTNSRTVRGNKRVTMGSGRVAAGQKT
ncbi:MAG: 30S ribosomal protein S13 [Parcubacteria group bacterium GW2011_GWA2_36_10]|nr:MAG: 30S ribosomal protein S13 [Parcubacteria group bacterium GW2011_GWA2_36_10]